MVELARWMVRNKVGVIAVLAIAAVMTSGNKQPAHKGDPWAIAPAQTVTYSEHHEQTVGQTAAKALTVVAREVGMEKVLPDDLVKNTKGNWDNTAEAVKGATAAN